MLELSLVETALQIYTVKREKEREQRSPAWYNPILFWCVLETFQNICVFFILILYGSILPHLLVISYSKVVRV